VDKLHFFQKLPAIKVSKTFFQTILNRLEDALKGGKKERFALGLVGGPVCMCKFVVLCKIHTSEKA